MPEQPYTENPQLDRFLTNIKDGMNAGFGGVNSRLDTLNGKVAAHEATNNEFSKWRERVNGGMLASGVFMTVIVIPILLWAVWSLVNFKDSMRAEIKDALSIYEVP